MKKNLGKIGLMLFLIQTLLLADQLATYTLSANKYEAMVKEPIIITFEVQQKDTTDNMFFLMVPLNSPDYEIKLLKSINDDTKEHHAKVSITYLLFPLKEKKIGIKFNFTIQTASDQALAQSYVDDHDGGKAIQKVNHSIELKPLTIDVRKSPSNIDLYGDFTLQAQIDRHSVAPYEDVNILYTLQGEGYTNQRVSLLNMRPSVTLFKDIHNEYTTLTKNGYKTKRIYTYALSSTENFEVPALHLQAYSFTKQKIYNLDAPSFKIHVKAIDPKTLLDKKDAPFTARFFSAERLKIYFIYTMIFIFGFLSAKLLNMNFKQSRKKDSFTDIKESKNPQQLILILLNHYNTKDSIIFIEELEKIAYKQSSQNFSELKKEILKVFSK